MNWLVICMKTDSGKKCTFPLLLLSQAPKLMTSVTAAISNRRSCPGLRPVAVSNRLTDSPSTLPFALLHLIMEYPHVDVVAYRACGCCWSDITAVSRRGRSSRQAETGRSTRDYRDGKEWHPARSGRLQRCHTPIHRRQGCGSEQR